MNKSWGLEVQACEGQQEEKLSAKLSRCDTDNDNNRKRKEPIRLCPCASRLSLGPYRQRLLISGHLDADR